MGYLKITMPRTRNLGAPTEVLGRYKRREEEVDEAITSAYVHGVSTRDMSELTRSLMGEDVSRSTVSRVTKRLEHTVEALRTKPIEEPMPYLFLDATFIDARWARRVENVAALVAYGISADGGKRVLLAVTIGAQESEASWSDLLTQLTARGLCGVRLVIADDHKGLAKAVRTHLPEAERQRCTVHFMRNVMTKSPARLRGRLAKELSKLFRSGSLKDAKKQLAELEGRWVKQIPEAVECLKAGFASATRYFAFPKEHWRRIRSTNGLERLHGEIKRRTRAVGAFPDRTSALRLVTAVVIHATEKWGDRRYLDMSLFDATEEIRQAA
jgi:transposase-like protein